MTTTEVKASDRSDTSRSFSSEASQPRIVYAASNRFGQGATILIIIDYNI